VPHTLLQWVTWSVIALVLGAMIFLLVRAFRERGKGAGGSALGISKSGADEDSRRVEALPLATVRRQADLVAEAEQEYRLGNYGQAIIYLFSYQLLQLDKRQLIHLSRGKTNRQYLRELSSRKALRRLVEQTMVVFEEAFFGQHTIDRCRFESCWTQLNEFEVLAAEGVK